MQEYVLYVDDGNGVFFREAYRGSLPYTTVSGLTPGREYSFKVQARNWNGYGANSTEVRLYSCVQPSSVPVPTLVAQNKTAVTLRWSEPLDKGGCEISSYKLYRDDGSAGAITTAVDFDGSSVIQPYIFEHVVVLGAPFSSLTVRFKLEATNREGSTLSAGYLSALVAGVPSAPPTAPQRLSSNATSLTVELPIVTGTGGITLNAYQLMIDDGLLGDFRNISSSGLVDDSNSLSRLQRTHTIGELVQGRVYRLKYYVANELGWSASSPVASLLAAGVPARPNKPTLVSVDVTQITLAFTEVLENGGSPILEYQLYARLHSNASFIKVAAYDQSMQFQL